MMIASPRTIQAMYVDGLLRPLEPIQDAEDQVYFVTILNIETLCPPEGLQTIRSLRGKYRGYLSSTDEFARNKRVEKALEL